MIYKIAFFCKHFTERGTEKTTYDYAEFNENILGNQSFIICFSDEIIKKNKFHYSKKFVKDKYRKRFQIFEIENIYEIKDILINNQITHFYTQSHGFHRDIFQFSNSKIWGNCKTIYHCAFGPMVRQGSTKRCIVGSYLNKRFSKDIPVLPPIVRPYKNLGDLRKKLGIPENGIVIGRHGGKQTFDIQFVKDCIRETIENDKNIYFLFVNTEKFIEHSRIFYFYDVSDLKLSKFIGTCDAMIHGRYDGETFGLAVAEFSVANKPVITYGKSKDKEHLIILKNKCLIYNNKKELLEIFKQLKFTLKIKRSWNAYEDYEPASVMKKFEDICFINQKESLYKLFITFLRDLPWEIIVFFKSIINIIKTPFFKVIPRSLKDKVKTKIKSLKGT